MTERPCIQAEDLPPLALYLPDGLTPEEERACLDRILYGTVYLDNQGHVVPPTPRRESAYE